MAIVMQGEFCMQYSTKPGPFPFRTHARNMHHKKNRFLCPTTNSDTLCCFASSTMATPFSSPSNITTFTTTWNPSTTTLIHACPFHDKTITFLYTNLPRVSSFRTHFSYQGEVDKPSHWTFHQIPYLWKQFGQTYLISTRLKA